MNTNDIIGRRIASLWFGGELLDLIPSVMSRQGDVYVCEKAGVEFHIQLNFYDEDAFYSRLSMRNISNHDSPRILNVRSFDCTFDSLESPTLSTLTGDSFMDKSQTQVELKLPDGFMYTAQPTGGRSSNTTAFPYMNITDARISRVFAVGWSGQWKADILSAQDSYRFMLGIDQCDFYLKSGESVIFPSILVMEGSNLAESRNAFRRLILSHFSPARSPETLRPLSMMVGSCFDDSMDTEEYLLDQLRSSAGYDFDVVWADAIWFKGGWDRGVGNYDFKAALPHGMRPVSDLAHSLGRRYLQWFEVERAFPKTDMYMHHRDGLLKCYTRTEFDLVDLGNEHGWEQVYARLSAMLEEQGIDILRQDANIDPLLYWEYNDEKGRSGIRQLHYVEGLYRLWDRLLARFPHLMIDNCASGGRRLDFEAMRRSVSFCSSDYPNDRLEGDKIKYNLIHMANLNLYVPNISNLSSCAPNDVYYFRAGFNGAISLRADVFIQDSDSQTAKALLSEAKRLRPYYFGDFYPLTDEFADLFVYQFTLGDTGMAMFLRHASSQDACVSVSLHGLREDSEYEVRLTDEAFSVRTIRVRGKDLCSQYMLTLPKAPSSMVLEYHII